MRHQRSKSRPFGTRKQFGLQLYVRREPDAERSKIRVACAGDKPTLVHAACAAKRRVAAILGDAAVEEAELLVSERRAAAGRSDMGVERNVNAVLGETQRLRATLHAAETRASKAEMAAERAEAQAAEAAAAIVFWVIEELELQVSSLLTYLSHPHPTPSLLRASGVTARASFARSSSRTAHPEKLIP